MTVATTAGMTAGFIPTAGLFALFVVALFVTAAVITWHAGRD